jgi:lipid A disaccharide synthetase
LIQEDFTAERLAQAAFRLLDDPAAGERMRRDLAEITAKLRGEGDAMEAAADEVMRLLEEHVATS